MAAVVDVRIACDDEGVPDTETIRDWVQAALASTSRNEIGDVELAVCIVDTEEIRALNHRFCGQDKATNVLSFPAGEMAGLPAAARRMLGDIVVCAPVIRAEAGQQGKPLAAHWAHMLVHGTLHLLGYDHEADADAAEMEGLEIEILASGKVTNPYRAC